MSPRALLPRAAAVLALATSASACLLDVPDVRDAAPPAPTAFGPMIDVTAPDGTAYRVDKTEVTNAAYAAFLAAGGGDPATVGPPGCADDHDATPRDDWPAPDDLAEHPVVHVDWCDAHAYCAAVGKHLCAGILGAPYAASQDQLGDAAQSEWYNACSASGTRVYPYGDDFDGVCNGAGGPGSTTPVLERTGCEGGFPGIFGMSGNAREWEGCVDEDLASASCAVRGGAFQSNPAEGMGDLGCVSDFLMARDDANAQTGFRCCQ